MDPATKAMFKAQIASLSGMNQNFRGIAGIPIPPAMGGNPPMPVMIQPALTPLLGALQQHADEFEKLLRLLDDIVTKS